MCEYRELQPLPGPQEELMRRPAEEILVIGRGERKTHLLMDAVRRGARLMALNEYEDRRHRDLHAAMLAPASLGFEELARCLPNPGDNWLNIGIPTLGDLGIAPTFHPSRCPWGAPPKVGKPGAAVLKARRERNKNAAKSRRRNRG